MLILPSRRQIVKYSALAPILLKAGKGQMLKGIVNPPVVASGGVLASSSFTGADEDPISEGGVWTDMTAGGNNVVRVSNAYSGTVGLAGNGMARHSATPNADQYSQAVISTQGVGVACRCSDAADTGYYCVNVFDNCYVVRRVAGSDTGGTGSPAACTGSGHTLKMTVTGTGATVTVKIYKNGSEIFSWGDTDAGRITTAGFLGISAFTNVGAGDTWEGGNL